MSAMMAAIKARKSKGMAIEGDHQDGTHMAEHADDQQKDLHGLVASLSEHEKGQLKQLLHSDNSKASQIQKGEASSEETGKIESQMQDENQKNSLQQQQDEMDHPQSDSDDIAKSMIDHKAITAVDQGNKPRNLGERAKMYAASKLKAKGKI